MFVSFIQWQIPSILQGNKSTLQTYIASIAQQKVRSKSEVDFFVRKKPVENQKCPSLGRLQNSAELIGVVTIGDIKSLNLNTASESVTLI